MDEIPSITISKTDLIFCLSLELTIFFRLGQYSKFVDAIKLLYFDPTFEPDLLQLHQEMVK